MRRFVRERETLFAALDADLAVRTAHPAWLVERLQEAWGERTAALLSALAEMEARLEAANATVLAISASSEATE